MHEPGAEERLHATCRRVELVQAARPDRDIEAHLEEPLGSLCDAVLELEGILQGRPSVRISAPAVLFRKADRRRELGDSPLEESHH